LSIRLLIMFDTLLLMDEKWQGPRYNSLISFTKLWITKVFILLILTVECTALNNAMTVSKSLERMRKEAAGA